MAILVYKGSNPSSAAKHGNYITAYKNLGRVDVKKGDIVKAKQKLAKYLQIKIRKINIAI